MAKKETQKVIEIVLDDSNPDQKTKVLVKKPSNRVQSEAARIGALVWTKCIKDGVMTKQELDAFMKEKGIWGDDKEKRKEQIAQELSALEKRLYLGDKDGNVKRGGRKKRMKLSEAKTIALEMRTKRAELRDLLAEKITLETNTAESLSENAKFDYIVANCTFTEDGTRKIYASIEDYEKRAEDPIAFNAAATLAEMMYSVNKDFEAKLPENKFLSRFKLVNEDLSLVNKEGQTVDTKGNIINDLGHYLDAEGNRIDLNGNPLDEDGNYEFAIQFDDDLGVEEEAAEKAEKVEETEDTES
ncbi:MAG: hypothetical protein FI729_01905 [SAR202 cluster bacterium]|mgnify:FL=1|nr:hypothetical protein [SAR202 cluster bacterium]|tara:strand:- start:55569 stop:56468 length:900 start_codon:yes stop_codon:yes gene_type:complete